MNKIKLMYDIARAMRDQDSLAGTMKLKLMKDGIEVFRLDNEFSRDFSNGWGKARISTFLDHEGKQFRHESNTEFNVNQEQENKPQRGKKRQVFHEHLCGMHDITLRKRLDTIMMLLNALNNMKVLEPDDKSICLSLDLNEIPEDLNEVFRMRMMQKQHGRYGFLQGSPVMEKGTLECRINRNYEIENITVKLEGKLQGDNQPDQDLTMDAAAVFDR